MVLLPTTENLCPLELIQLYFVSGSRGFRMQKGSHLYQPVFINDLMYPGHKGFPGSSDGRVRLQMWETWVPSLGWEDPLEEGVATHSSILAWRISWTEEAGRLQSIMLQRVGHIWATNFYFHMQGMMLGPGWKVVNNECLSSNYSVYILKTSDPGRNGNEDEEWYKNDFQHL